jgi:hypothetical protein
MGCWSGVQGLAAVERQAPVKDMAWPGGASPSPGSREHPSRSLLMRAERGNPVEVRTAVREADREEGLIPRRGSDDREANAGSRKATGNRDQLASLLRLVAANNWPDTGLCGPV